MHKEALLRERTPAKRCIPQINERWVGELRQGFAQRRTSGIPQHSSANRCVSYSKYANPMKKSPSVPVMAYTLAISDEGGFATPLVEEEEDDDPVCPATPVKTAVASADVELAVPEAEVAVELVLAVLGLLAPQGWSCLHALAQELSLPQFFTHWVPHSVQTK